MTIQLVGAISNEPNYLRLFDLAQIEAMDILGVTKVINPCSLPHNHDRTWESYMIECLESIEKDADAIYLLRGWKLSDGARMEHELAVKLKKTIYYQN